jgi:uncharacterized protein (DUF2249 family)
METSFQNPEGLPVVDARELDCKVRIATILNHWHCLLPGAAFILLNNIDPLPLYYQLRSLAPEGFGWEYLQRGPELFAIRVQKQASQDEESS